MSRGSHGFSAVRQVWHYLKALTGGKIAAAIIGLAYLAIAARQLGVTGYGVLNLVHGYAAFVGGIVAFSGWHGVVRYGEQAMAAGQHRRLVDLLRYMAFMELGFAAVAILVAAFAAPIIGPRLGWTPDAVRFGTLYSVAVLATVRTTPHGLLQIAGRFDLIGVHQTIMPLVRLVGALLALLVGGGLQMFIVVWLIAALAEGISMWIMGFWVYKRMDLDPNGDDSPTSVRQANSGLLHFALTTNADITLRELAPRAIPLIVGWMLGASAVGLLMLAQRVGTVLQQPAQMLGQAGYAVFARLVASRQLNELRRTVWQSVGGAMAVGAVLTVLVVFFAGPILTLIGDKGFESASFLLFLITFARLVSVGVPALAAGLTALGRPGATVTVNLVTNIAFLPALIGFIHLFGVNGAGWHMLVQAGVNMMLHAWLFRKVARRAEHEA